MIILIPLGGTGSRFKNNNYKRPKALINVFGKPILYHLLDNLYINTELVYIPYNAEYYDFNFESTIKCHYPHIRFKFLKLTHNTRGAAETINIALNNLEMNKDMPVLCVDGDNFYSCDIIHKWKGTNCVFSTKDTSLNSIYSYIKHIDEKIIDIQEKVKISDNICTGAYGFKSFFQLKRYSSNIIKNNIMQHSEFYTSGVIREMLKDDIPFYNIPIKRTDFICLGTPLQLQIFYNNYPKISCVTDKTRIKMKRICFDLDNTLVTYPVVHGDYSTVEPITKTIEILRYLKEIGNTIIIYTARRMKTHGGNVGKINADIGKITFDTLTKFDIPYDEIYFGKPYADFYIDDLAINTFDDLEKELGYYQNIIVAPRSFHTINEINIDIIVKKGSSNLSGEIYYYKNIPANIKDLFPIMLESESTSSLSIEKIRGLTVSQVYLTELLTDNVLIHIMNSIKRIQDCVISNENNLNIYKNYANKIKKRFSEYNYSVFKDSDSVYKDILNGLELYENTDCGRKTVIHGDPVFTNIIINEHGKIKFIDMRGKVGEQLTIYGDWLYDWSKLLQSLIGYDSILLSKKVSSIYKSRMLACFKDYFLENYGHDNFTNLKLITKSLIFTLIPLHNNSKCTLYYELISDSFLA